MCDQDNVIESPKKNKTLFHTCSKRLCERVAEKAECQRCAYFKNTLQTEWYVLSLSTWRFRTNPWLFLLVPFTLRRKARHSRAICTTCCYFWNLYFWNGWVVLWKCFSLLIEDRIFKQKIYLETYFQPS